MAASANPSGAHGNTNGSRENTNGGTATCNGENSAAGNPKTELSHNPGISLDWTAEEQSILEDLLQKLTAEPSVVRYAKIAKELKDKTVRDVALRCRWMNKKESGKRRKDDHNSSRKNKDKKEKVTDSLPKSSQLASRSNGPPYAQSMMALDSDDGIPFDAIGGVAGQMLEQNQHALEQISANFSSYKINDNIHLFRQARNNILSILNDCNDMPEIMKAMPPLPVKLNDELAKMILDQQPMQMQQRRS